MNLIEQHIPYQRKYEKLINKMKDLIQENKWVNELIFELPLNYTKTRLSPLNESPVKLYSFLMEEVNGIKHILDQITIPLDNDFIWEIIKQEGKFVTLSYTPKSNNCDIVEESNNDKIEENILMEKSFVEKSEDDFIKDQLQSNKSCRNTSCYCKSSCKVGWISLRECSKALLLTKKEVVKDMQEVVQDLITGDSGEHTKEDLNNLNTVLEKHKDLSDSEYTEEIEKLIKEEIEENKKINNEIHIDYHNLLESKFICNTKKECKTLKKLLLQLNLLSVCYECDVCYIVKAVHCGVVNYNPLVKNNDSYEKTLNIYSSIQEIEFEEAKRNIEYYISERKKTFNKFQISNSKYLKPNNCKLIPVCVSSPYEKKFTIEDVTDLQDKVYKITGKGEVMQLFNELLGINAG